MDEVAFNLGPPGDLQFVSRVESISGLISHQLTLYKVSPLFGLGIEETYLSNFEDDFKEHLCAQFADVNVKMKREKSLMYSPFSLKISIYERNKLMYESVMLSLSDLHQNETILHLPLLCVIQQSKFASEIHFLIEKYFMCNIKPFIPSDDEFTMLWGLALHEHMRRDDCDELCMTYKIPGLSYGELTFIIPEECLTSVWNCEQNFVQPEKVKELWLGIENHIFIANGILVSHANLESVILNETLFTRKSQFQIKVESAEIIYSLLLYIISCIK